MFKKFIFTSPASWSIRFAIFNHSLKLHNYVVKLIATIFGAQRENHAINLICLEKLIWMDSEII